MDANGSSKRSRRATKKLKFKPKVPPQKLKKSTAAKPLHEEQKPIDEDLMKILRTREVAVKTLPKSKDERSTHDSPPTPPYASVVGLSPLESGVHKKNPSVVQNSKDFSDNRGVFYDENDDDDYDDFDDDNDSDSVEFQETQPTSVECEASTHPAQELDLLQEQDGKERMFLFQLPKSLPLPRGPSVVQRKGKGTSKEVKEGSNLQQLPQGYFGKMLVYKSGKIKMKLGDAMFDVNPGAESRMGQHAVALNSKEKHCCVLGEIENRHVIVTPNVDSLLNDN